MCLKTATSHFPSRKKLLQEEYDINFVQSAEHIYQLSSGYNHQFQNSDVTLSFSIII
jgi:hypothetical protein